MSLELKEIEIDLHCGPIPEKIAKLHDEGIRRSKKISCFDFVPSNSCLLYAALKGVEPGTFCEWGSGIGIGVGVAESLGFQAFGIELDKPLSAASRKLLSDFGFRAEIKTGSYFEIESQVETYFAYCWPGQMRQMEDHFLNTTPRHSRLLYGYGADEIRCMIKSESKVVA